MIAIGLIALPASLARLTAPPGPPRSLPAPRSDFFIPGNMSYHNCATLGPAPRSVVRDATRDWALLESNPADEYFGMFTDDPFTQRNEMVRAKAADYLGSALDEMALMPSTTIGLNNVAEGLLSAGFLADGDHVLTTDQEHAGGYVCWEHFVNCSDPRYKPYGCTARPHRASSEPTLVLDRLHVPVLPRSAAPKTVAEIVAMFEAALKRQPKTKVVALSHVTTTHGLTFPVKEIAAVARAHGAITVVDGAQALGMAVNVTELGVDVYATSAHKWMLAPKGSGLLYISQSVQSWVTPTLLDEGFAPYTGASGTRPAITIQGLGYAIDYLNSFGRAAISKHNLDLRARFYDMLLPLTQSHNFSIIGPPGRDGPLVSPILAFSLPPPWTSHSFAQAMHARGFIVKQAGRSASANEGGPDMPLQASRITFHLFNSVSDLERLFEAVETTFDGGG